MSDSNINNMNIKQLRNEVQLLRDEIAIMKRNFEDILYNLDTDNFSTRVVKQGENMYTKIEQNAESISLQAEKVSENSQNIATLEVTADKIYSEVYSEDEDGTEVSRITQNAESITSEVEARKEEDGKLSTKITQTASSIRSEVSNVESRLNSSIEQNADNISMIVSDDENESIFLQTSSGFEMTGNVKVTQIMQVDGNLYIGDYDSRNEIKSIYFNNVASIRTAKDGWGYDGLSISSSVLYLLRPDKIFLVNPNNTSSYITLDSYIKLCISEQLG